jgi:hypothetical protein
MHRARLLAVGLLAAVAGLAGADVDVRPVGAADPRATCAAEAAWGIELDRRFDLLHASYRIALDLRGR